MDFLEAFKKSLLANKQQPSKATVKNYLADVRKFIRWFESRFGTPFNPLTINAPIIEAYEKEIEAPLSSALAGSAPRSLKRYHSSLRRFFQFLELEKLIVVNPLAKNTNETALPIDAWHMKKFKHFLYGSKASKLTIKNYLADIGQFTQWIERVFSPQGELSDTQLLQKIDNAVIEEYKSRLVYDAKLSPLSVNRKLSSLRKYLDWAVQHQLITKPLDNIQRLAVTIQHQSPPTPSAPTEIAAVTTVTLEDLKKELSEEPHDEQPAKTEYSGFAPLRLLQKTTKIITYSVDSLIFNPLAKAVESGSYTFWKISGKKVFAPIEEVVKSSTDIQKAAASTSETAASTANPASLINHLLKNQTTGRIIQISNIPKSVYYPLAISIKNFPFAKRLVYHLLHTRPLWYKKYHAYPITHYFHFAILVVFTTVVGFNIYQGFIDEPRSQRVMAAIPEAPPKMLSFQGRLTDSANNPLTAETPLRFGIYTSETATGAALLWQETQNIKPDSNGSFSTLLGKSTPLSQDIFSKNATLFIGITVASGEELSPRQQLATVGYSANAKTLQGLKPITEPKAGTNNVLLALDSAGNLTIGGSASPVFQATGGEFTLSGQTLTLTTNEGSNSNVQIKPDGSGIIDLQKPIQNTSNYNNLPGAEGAVEIDDVMAIAAQSSTQSALIVNQNGTGDLISASQSGIAKFSVSGSGTGMFAGNLTVNGNYLTSSASTFNLLNTNVINLNIGNGASAISLGAQHGVTTINNSLKVKGTTTFGSAVSAIGLFTANAGIALPTGQTITMAGFLPGSLTFIDSKNQLATDTNSLFWDASAKRLGLGTNSPTFRLDVRDSLATGAAAQIYNTDTSGTAVGLNVKLGNTTTNALPTANHFINFETVGIGLAGSIRGNGSNGIQIQNSAVADFAEYFKKDSHQNISYGSIVCLNPSGNVFPCDKENGKIVGIASEHPAFIGGKDLGNGSIEVGLTGLVKTIVSTKNGLIEPGDIITSSTATGVGVKATKAGMVVGRALEGYTNSDPNARGTIMVSVHVSWYDPQTALNENGILTYAGQTIASGQAPSKQELTLMQGVIANLQAGIIEVGKISVQSSMDITIGTQTLQEYIESTLAEILRGKVVSPIAEINTLHTDLVSPLASDSAISLSLDNSQLTIHAGRDASSAAVATIDNQGNASFSGTLRAKKIIADDIELSEEAKKKLATGSATYVTNITNIYNSTASATQAASPSAVPAQTTPTPPLALANANATVSGVTSTDIITNVHKATSFADVATFSAELAYVPNLRADLATFDQGLIALGPSSFTDLSVQNQLSVGSNMKITETAINTIGSDLNLQPLRQGNLSIMAGLVVIDTEGGLSVSGNATFAKDVTIKGKLFANLLAPIPNQDLAVQLDNDTSNFAVKDKAGTNVVKINHLGDVIASGTGKFADVAANALNIVRGAQADTSLTETVASGSAGWAIISANETERTIFTPYVKKESLIYITATSDTQGVTPYVARQIEDNKKQGIDGSFTIQIPESVTNDIKVNWWIVN